ncbi:protein of unknown function (DUF1992) [Geosmithia morbida]|uniref:DnaJ homologue subfamily C member 28 conserved domain-containing protein n=1 Tax=Geosmithia morbida TaxID=1094350 RepID=A0A9P4Z3F5_9HYPO|nr:protein of unknown function (DUF1992) [Geosmithia morbida]KAF4125924.1 protein of unknown function (DUF1992) [Geosmithia morbida]
MSRRLEQATEEAMVSGGLAGQRAIEDAGFSKELKAKLLDRVQDAKFRQQFAGAFAEVGMPAAAGVGTRATAMAQPWTGQESTEDAVLRMLDDSKKPLGSGQRGKFEPPPVDMRIKREPVLSTAERAGRARDKAHFYPTRSSMENSKSKVKGGKNSKETKGMSEEEKEGFREEYRERFAPFGVRRGMPNTLGGLAAMANERIEDAIARGQFKNIPRGTSIKRDARADNPFIDTTEYIMNKMIQRQEILPPWIEKQQDLMRQLGKFRERIRRDWKRHVADSITASSLRGGGSLAEQMERAEWFAKAERVNNPRLRSVDQIPVPTNVTEDPVMVKMRQQVDERHNENKNEDSNEEGASAHDGIAPFRDAAWEEAQKAYMTLAINELNAMTRAYNLMAPDLAKKPYFSLQRELASCFSDVAPQVAGEIKDRATRPKNPAAASAIWSLGTGSAGVAEKKAVGLMDHFRKGDDYRSSVLESGDKPYGFKEWWRDMRGLSKSG